MINTVSSVLTIALAIALFASVAPAHDSPIDHIDRIVQIYLEGGKLHLIYRFRCEERQAMLQLLQMDTNGDGKISDDERDAYFNAVAEHLARELHIEVDGKAMQLTCDSPVRLAPDLSQTFHLTAPLADLSIGAHTGKFTDDFSRAHPGAYRWSPRQINRNGIDVDATAAPGVEQLGPHPAMVVVNLRIVVRPIPTTQATTRPAGR